MIKIFISYSHDDELFLEKNIIPMLDELTNENVAEYFYDRKLRADGDLFDTIDFHMKDCDIAIVLLSEAYYTSKACTNEKESLLNRRNLEGIYFLPVVVSACDWKNDDTIKNNLFLNTDAKELLTISDNELKQEIAIIKKRILTITNDIETIKKLSFSASFTDVLQDTDVLKTSHRSKNTLLLSDVFIYPTLQRFIFDDKDEAEIDSEKIFENSWNKKFVFISGDDVSGKSSLLKQYVSDLNSKNFIPLLFSAQDNFDGHIFNVLTKKFKNQFNVSFDDATVKKLLENNKERIVIFVDDFHKISNRQNIIKKMDCLPKVICTVDLIYNLDYEIKYIKDVSIQYSIKELSPKQRNVLIKKWLCLDTNIHDSIETDMLKEIDMKTEQIEIITCKSLNGGIMPAYPFLVLSVLSNTETLKHPLNQQITSYGYCYEALIIIAFTKSGLRTDAEIGGAINFLAYFAHDLYEKEIHEMPSLDFGSFLNKYEEKTELPFKKDVFIKKLEDSRLIIKSTLGNYRFDYKYMYYYFIAKYFSENTPSSLSEIEKLCKNIHNDENAYIVIFFSHHSKSEQFYNFLQKEADETYATISAATLTKSEMKFFDDSYKTFIDIALPNKAHNYKEERIKRLENKSERKYSSLSEDEADNFNDEYVLNLRKSIKLTEVIGLIVKNRYTSIEKQKVKQLLISAIDLNFRELNAFFDLFKDPKNQDEIIKFIADAVKKEISKKDIDGRERLKKAGEFFWSINFFYVFVVVLKTIQSLGSEKLVSFLKDIAEDSPTPANQLILEGAKIIYAKNIDKKIVFKHMKDSEYSDVAKTILKILVVEYCRMNPVDFSEIQQLSAKMKISIRDLKK